MTALFPSGKGGGKGVAYGYKGKGVTSHVMIDAQGGLVGIRGTPANAPEREEVAPLLDALPAKPTVLQADKGYDAFWLRWNLEHGRGIKTRIPKRQWPKTKKPEPIAGSTRWMVERSISWCQRKYRRFNIKWERLWSPWAGFLNIVLIHYWLVILVG